MNGWIIAFLAIQLLGLGMSLARHGQKKEGTHDFWSHLLGFAIVITLLYMGGVFRPAC